MKLPYNINDLITAVNEGKIKWSMHVWKRLRERKISTDDFKNCICTGEIIEEYPDDPRSPSCIVSGLNISQRPLHDVVGYSELYLQAITAYYPDLNEWENDFKTRKGRGL